MKGRTLATGFVLLAALAFAAPEARAQVFTGRIEVTVSDSTGALLPGATVDITGPQNRSSVTDTRGAAVFLNLPPGTYGVRTALAGFNEYENPNVPVSAGVSVPLKVVLAIGGVTQQVDVTADSPVIDPKKVGTSTNVTLEELQQVPSARDPWVVLQTVPGVVVDRVNVGGAESGQQSNYQAKGATGGDNTWNMDGVPITDMAALGSSPTYYDFDMFQEMQVTTGGADLMNATPGVALNFVLKGGSNTPHGSARLYYENESMQSNNMPEDLKATIGGVTGKGNRIDEYRDYGFEIGGPVLRDRIWAWGAYGKTRSTLLTLANTADKTLLDNVSFKATGQITPGTRASYTFFRGDKTKFGRNASPTRPPETTWNQSGPTAVHKGEGSFALGSNVFLTGRYSYVGGGFLLTPQGGLDTPMYRDDARVWHQSYNHYDTDRPQWAASGDGNFFHGRHEIKFGFGWRRADVDSSSIVPGNGVITRHTGYPSMKAEVTAWNDYSSVRGEYAHGYIGDTITFNRATVSAGLRWDRQSSSVKALSQTGNAVLPDKLPDVTGEAADDVVVWTSVSPRIGLSYALDDSRRTLVRASYGTFASQLNATTGNFLSTVQYRGVYYYGVQDLNGNNIADPGEFSTASSINWYGFDYDDPLNPTEPINSVGDYSTPRTHEVQVGLDRELMTNFGISGTFTWRRFTNFTWRNNGVVGTEYEQIDTATGTHPAVGSYSVPIYGASYEPENQAATVYRARDGYSQRYWGIEVAATKRLSNRWMMRLGFSTNDHREYFDSPAAHGDPTPLETLSAVNGTGPNQDGGLVMTNTTGSGKSGIYQVLPKYQFVGTGLYQAPWGINLGANLVSRQGFSTPYHLGEFETSDPLASVKNVLVIGDVGEYRLPTVTSLDARVGKEFVFNRARVNIDLDMFNVLNANTVLGREYDLNASSGDRVLEIMNPRVLRLGLRFNF